MNYRLVKTLFCIILLLKSKQLINISSTLMKDLIDQNCSDLMVWRQNIIYSLFFICLFACIRDGARAIVRARES